MRIWLPRSTAAETPVEPVPGTVWLQKPFTLEQLRGLLGELELSLLKKAPAMRV